MALANEHLSQSGGIAHILLTPFRAVWAFLILLAENNSRMRAVQKLNDMTDEELAEKGLTRLDAVQQIFGDRYFG